MSYIKSNQNYYVYQCKVDGVVRYIGKGIGERYLHCIKGNSTCRLLNRDMYAGKYLEVEIIHSDLTEVEALKLERKLIKSMPYELYNSSDNKFPYVETEESTASKDEVARLWDALQASIVRERKARIELEKSYTNQRQAIWVKTLNLKRGKDDQKLTTYLLMLENQKLARRVAQLESALQTKEVLCV